jgi:hypothetical protein
MAWKWVGTETEVGSVPRLDDSGLVAGRRQGKEMEVNPNRFDLINGGVLNRAFIFNPIHH